MPEHIREADSTDSDQPVDPLADDFETGDPVIDLANGRNMVIVRRVADRTDTHSERENYDFLSNTGNERLRTSPADPVFECVYVNSVASTPSKTYDFPSSRLGRPEYDAPDGVRRVRDQVAIEVLESLFEAIAEPEGLASVAKIAGIDPSAVDEARETARAAASEVHPPEGDE